LRIAEVNVDIGRQRKSSMIRKFLVPDGLSADDPTATLAVHCGNSFDAGFRPYQCTRLNRYDAVF
jgi:hypothetical protein